jgi:branched-chain amino acid transport system permease protein
MMTERLPSRSWVFLGFGILLAVLILLPPILPAYVTILITQSLIFAIVAMSLDILIGYTGLGALGHAAFFAIGAYTTAILVTKHQAPLSSTLLWSIVLAAGSSAAVAFLPLRAGGIYFLMITLAIAMCTWGLAYRWVSLTGGDNGITGIPRPDLGLPWKMSDPVYFYYLILVLFLISTVLLFILIRSPFGKTLVGIRDSETRMKVLGYNIWLHKYLAFVIAGAFAGLAGCLYAYYNSFVGPNDANLGICMELLLMVILGGPGTLFGAGLGAFIITFLKNMVSVYTERWLMVMAAVYILVALYAPDGIMGLLRDFQKRRQAGRGGK